MKRIPIALSALLLLAFAPPDSGEVGQSVAELHVRTLSAEKVAISAYKLVIEAGKGPRLVGRKDGNPWSHDLAGLWELSYQTGVIPEHAQDKVKAFFQVRGSSSLEGELIGGDPADPRWFRFKMSGSKEGLVLRQHLLALRLKPVRKAKVESTDVGSAKASTAARGTSAKNRNSKGQDEGGKPVAGPKKALDGGFARALASPPENRDLIFVEDKKDRVRSFACDVRGADSKGVTIEFRGQTRSLPLSRIYGIVFGTLSGVEPVIRKQGEIAVEVTLRDKRRFRGKLLELDKDHWTLMLADKLTVRFRSLLIQDSALDSDRLVYVSDLEVKDRIQKPMLGREWPILRNHAGGGAELRLSGESYRKGFLLVPDVSFRVDFPRTYTRLLGRVGMPKSIVGSAVLRFLVDGEQIGSDYKLEANGQLLDIDLDLKGAKELSLELEHSADLDAGARVILGNLRAINTR